MIDKSDRNLVGDTVESVLTLHGAGLDIKTLPETHRVLLLVNQAHARITNGGFQNLLKFEQSDYATCQMMANAHEQIEAEGGYLAFRKFLRGTLWIKPTSPILRPFNRFRLGLSIAKALIGFDTADTLYFESSDVTYAQLAKYVSSRRGDFPTTRQDGG